MDAITLLKNDHKTVEALFKKFEKLGNGAERQKRQIVAQIIKELSIHAAIEEQVFYPAVRKGVKTEEDDVLEALEEHHIVKWTLSELEGLDPKDERFDAKVTVLMESVRHHVKEEEGGMFPAVAKKLEKRALEALGKAMETAKKLVPKRPHPRAPDSPPANVVVGLGASVLDKARDLVQSVAKRGLSARNGALKASPGRSARAAVGAAQKNASRARANGSASPTRAH